jgi:Flp pilus assembly protein TadB
MANRAERRAQAKADRRGKNDNGQQVRSRAGLLDESSLQRKSENLSDRGVGEWVPSASSLYNSSVDSSSDMHRRRTPVQWVRFFFWFLIIIAAVAFIVVMWIPSLPQLVVVIIAAVLAVGVLSLFFTRPSHEKNPYLDENGTAV